MTSSSKTIGLGMLARPKAPEAAEPERSPLAEQAPERPGMWSWIADTAGGATEPANNAAPKHRGMYSWFEAERELAAMSPRFGHSFTGVKLHTGEAGDARARSHGAKAVAEGKDIYLARDVKAGSPEGRRILAHEMAHVVQQTAAPTSARPIAKPSSRAFEREAHRVGDIVAAGGFATPVLRTAGVIAQGYESPEHKAMEDDVHSELDPVVPTGDAKGRPAEVGGVTSDQVAAQKSYEERNGVSHTPGMSAVAPGTTAATPRLAQMLADDPFKDGARTINLSLRNFQLQTDAAGPFLGIELDPKTQRPVRYDVPVSPGDMTALSGDLYGSVENLRKAPVSEVLTLQQLLGIQSKIEQQVRAFQTDSSELAGFDLMYEQATMWRSQRVYAPEFLGDLGPAGAATEGDTKDYKALALDNKAHFGQSTASAKRFEIVVRQGKRGGSLSDLAKGPQGNAASGNEEAWLGGHARALLLAKESYDLRRRPSPPALTDKTRIPAPKTGLLFPGEGAPEQPHDENGNPLKRSSEAITADSKLNDAYLENAAASHYLTDAFAAGHQIEREVIGKVIEDFVRSQGREQFLDRTVALLQQVALEEDARPRGKLGQFQVISGLCKAVGRAAMKSKLKEKINDETLHGIGAKVVHDYYNRHGMIVRNRKGMTFEIKGDGRGADNVVARQIIALAVLESRNQITEMARKGHTGNPMEVWDYVPDLDRTQFTNANGSKVLGIMFNDAAYLWGLIKDFISMVETDDNAKTPAANGSRVPVDFGSAPFRAYFANRQAEIRSLNAGKHPRPGEPTTVDGLPVRPHRR